MNAPTASLHRRLIWRLIPALVLAIVLGGITSYFVAKRSADFAYDQALSAAAADIATGVHPDHDGATFDLSDQSERILRSDARDDIYFAVHLNDGRFVGGDRDLVETSPVEATEGASSDLSFRRKVVRAMSVEFVRDDVPFVVTVAETTRKRRAAALTIFAQLMVPTIVVLSLACLIVWFSVRGGLAPLEELQGEIEARSELDLSPIAAVGAPFEVRTLVNALNRLLARLDAATKAHQSFVADAAHQLRTPLAGLQTQVDLLSSSIDPAGQQALERMRFSMARAVRMVNQLLALARSEKDAASLRLERFDVAELVAECANSWVHRAIIAEIDLGFDLSPGTLVGDRYLIHELCENVIDNALHHTPRGGQITVGTRSDGELASITFDDSGPGIPAAQRLRVFERFYREVDGSADGGATGSGLGLAIVRQIALRHEGVAEAIQSPTLGGLCVQIDLPVRGPGSPNPPAVERAPAPDRSEAASDHSTNRAAT